MYLIKRKSRLFSNNRNDRGICSLITIICILLLCDCGDRRAVYLIYCNN
jgi:hypothetical protein